MKGFIFFISIIMPFVMNGNTLLEEGMKWRTQLFGSHEPELVASMEVVTLEKSAGGDCFLLYRALGEDIPAMEPIAYVKTDGDKVFFKPNNNEPSEWFLFYDFGLQPGEACFIYSPVAVSGSSTPYKTFIKCTGINESSENNGWITMALEEYTDDSCEILLGQGEWLKGLSSINGILYNNRFGVDGFGSKLVDVSLNNQVIYAAKSAGVSEIIGSITPNIRIDGLKVYISVNDGIRGSIYSQNGLHIGDYRLGKTATCVRVPNPGVYILKLGDTSRKILVP